jgi:hypothetical protein
MSAEKQTGDEVEKREQQASEGVTDLEQDFEQSNLSSKVENLLSTAVVDNAEIAKYVDSLVDAQYTGSVDTLKTFNLYNPEQPKESDVPAPTIEQAKEILAAHVTAEQLEVIKKMEKPTLQLIPVTSMERYYEALNSYKPMDHQKRDAYVSFGCLDEFDRADTRDTGKNAIVGWRIAVTEGAENPKLLEGDDPNKKLMDRAIQFSKEFKMKGASGVDLKRMIVLMMSSLKERKLVDNQTTGTYVSENSTNFRAPFVYWNDEFHCFSFDYTEATGLSQYARFRPSVIVDVPSS